MGDLLAEIPASQFLENFLPGDLGTLSPQSIQTASTTLSAELKVKTTGDQVYAPLVSFIPYFHGLIL